ARVGENTLDDPRIAQQVADHFGCIHEEIILEPDVAELLPKAIWHMDEPVADPAILNTYVLCAEAGKSSTVLLSGVGGDELFGGYRKYVAHYWAEAYRRVPSVVRRRLLEPAIGSMPSLRGSRLKGMVRLAQKMGRSASLPARERFLMNCTYLDESDRAGLYSADLAAQTQQLNAWDQHLAHFDRVSECDFLHQMQYLDLKMFLTSLNLNYNDKMSMASSVEVRVPFLDRRLFDYAATQVRPDWKVSGFWRPTTKHILREAMRGLIPECVFRQPKAGFFAPVDGWLAGELRPLVEDLLNERQVRERGLFRPEQVRRLIDDHRAGRRNWSMQIWQLLTLELWMQTFCDGRHVEQSAVLSA
ncbi:MAG: asparagine synthetase B, partial [Planctomycetaceae bacterium]